MTVDCTLHLALPAPRLPADGSRGPLRFVCAAGLHAAAIIAIVAAVPLSTPSMIVANGVRPIGTRVDVQHIVFIAREGMPLGSGGGGGGDRHAGPIRHATGVGSDPITLRVAEPVSTMGRQSDSPTLPAVLLDAKPLASGTVDQLGLPVGGVSYGTSTGQGSGGGVGEGEGTGIGPGRGPGFGPGSGGGMGGGPYRAGGLVTTPRVVTEVRPTYTNDALAGKIQGRVVLEFVVQANGHPSNIRIITSLDRGLDEQAITAASQWRFEPGRLAGKPVDVLVTLMLDFSIR
jgi:periplasmic protein TonB